MGFIENAADAAVGLSLDRVRQNLDASSFDPRPELDEKQQAELRAQQADGRTADAFKTVLTHYRFVWWDLFQLQQQLPGATLKTEGEWRNSKLRMAFTPSDLVSNFPGGPEQFDRYLRDHLMARRVSRGLLPKEVLRRERARK